MLDRVVELLAPALSMPDAVLVDATLGLAGHSIALLRRCPAARLVGIDRDPAALAIARDRLAEFGDRVECVHAANDELAAVLSARGLARVHAVLFDLGLSSMQVDRDDRGFSYSRDVPLDMRMDTTADRTAADVLAGYSATDLTRILRRYGEERHAARIAAAIVRHREQTPLRTTGELAALVEATLGRVPPSARRSGGHPAKRTFQALRIEVNRELDVLQTAVPAALDALLRTGRIVVLAYHSLEDRLVKQELARRATASVPPGVPVVPEAHRPTLRLLTRGAERPTDDEIDINPRARSARLRAAECIKEAA
jgi:16S rRNA (cytosine1402-N4)-methyltransferase